MIKVANTNQLPKTVCLCVVGADETKAIKELTSIADRKGYSLGEVYQFASVYYYAEVKKEGMK